MLIPPVVKGFSVLGGRGKRFDEVCLFFEEYEAIRLLDYRGMTQEEAAVYMEVSRPTLTRIYEDARRKVAKAFVEGRDLAVGGGDFFFDDSWLRCCSCNASFNSLENHVDKVCPVCGSVQVISLNEHYKR